MLTRSNAQAYGILAALIAKYYDYPYVNFTVEPYLNGRENGFAVTSRELNYNYKAVFAENRNSDDIVVYRGLTRDFSMQCNSLSEEVYASRKYFPFGNFMGAADYIQAWLTESKE